MNRQDTNGVRTAQDIERKYNLGGLSTLKKAVEQNDYALTKTEKTLEDFIYTTTDKLQELQDQVDGNITTWFYNGVPTLENAPANEWTTEVEKINHLGDLYYDQATGYAYRFTKEEDYKWIELKDSDVAEALAVANAAKDTADSKRTIFVNTPTVPYEVGDIWIFNDSELFRCKASRDTGEFQADEWVVATKYTDDSLALEVQGELNGFKEDVQKTYVTNSDFTRTESEIRGEVSTLSVEVGLKNKIYTEQPTPPYMVGDAWIMQDKVFICQTEKKADEEYDSGDWILNLNNSEYVTNSTLTQTAQDLTSLITGVRDEVDDFTSKQYITSSEFQQQTDELSINLKKEIIEGGVSRVTTDTGFTFDESGLTVSKSDADTKTNINENGLVIYSTTGDSQQEMQRTDSTGTYSENVSVRQFLIVGEHSRFQDYQDGTGCFYI